VTARSISAPTDRAHHHPERRRHGLDGGELADLGGIGGIPNDRRPRQVRRNLLEQLQPFPADAVFVLHETGGVAARPRQTRHEARANRIDDLDEHDRHGAGRPLHRSRDGGGRGQNDIRRERNQFGRIPAIAVGIARAPARLDPHVAAVGPAQLLQPLNEGGHAALRLRIVRG
jgi:hypothetical protein